jgi:membrane protein implicated in regulation of membrane protease activity
MQFTWFFIFGGLGAILLELILGVATGFDLALFGVALIIGGVAGNILNNIQASFIIAILLNMVYIFFGRHLLRSKLNIHTKNTNVDGLIGKSGFCVKETLSHQPGQVRVNNEIWRAESVAEIKKGDKIQVVSIEGVTLNVIKI